MGWLIEAAIDWFWVGFVERMSKGRPWWVWVFWLLSPVLALLAVGGLVWVLLGLVDQ